MIETGFGKEFSEPPQVTVSAERTHCEACQEPLDPNVMHKCHGNKEYQPPGFSSTEVTEACPKCSGISSLVKPGLFWAFGAWPKYVVVCGTCRTYVYPPVEDVAEAISNWNRIAALGNDGEPSWTQWRAALPGEDERAKVIPSDTQPSHPDLTAYKGACPAVHVEGEVCDWCENTGTIPPTKEDAQ